MVRTHHEIRRWPQARLQHGNFLFDEASKKREGKGPGNPPGRWFGQGFRIPDRIFGSLLPGTSLLRLAETGCASRHRAQTFLGMNESPMIFVLALGKLDRSGTSSARNRE